MPIAAWPSPRTRSTMTVSILPKLFCRSFRDDDASTASPAGSERPFRVYRQLLPQPDGRSVGQETRQGEGARVERGVVSTRLDRVGHAHRDGGERILSRRPVVKGSEGRGNRRYG